MTIENVSNPKLLKSVNEMRASVNHQVSVFNFRKKKSSFSQGDLGEKGEDKFMLTAPPTYTKKFFLFVCCNT